MDANWFSVFSIYAFWIISMSFLKSEELWANFLHMYRILSNDNLFYVLSIIIAINWSHKYGFIIRKSSPNLDKIFVGRFYLNFMLFEIKILIRWLVSIWDHSVKRYKNYYLSDKQSISSIINTLN